MDDFTSLSRTIERVVGIRTSQYKEDYIKRRVLSRMRISGKETFKDYHHLLISDDAEKESLKNALTINVTEFFRDPEVFKAVSQKVLPEIIGKQKKIRIWCAGCATGEEAYSYAILVREYMRMNPVDVRIYATDIDSAVLGKAREGTYDIKSLKNLTEQQIRRYFTLREDGRYELKPMVKEDVRFSNHDLTSGIPAARFLDLVSCRNVTIYFNENQKRDLAALFYEALSHDGYYVMGKTEYLLRESEAHFTPVDSIQKIYRKTPI
ncbi:MAG: chemotaxis protein methyltransferase CheR [Methanofollis sp.]|nr:chemotaxis protein methyltransferase CheR [Methanofollis sp.]